MFRLNRLFNGQISATLKHVVCKDINEAYRHALKPNVNLVVWEREVQARVLSFIYLLYSTDFSLINFVFDKGTIREKLMDHLSDYILLHKDGANKLVDDITLLANFFLNAANVNEARLQLRIVDNDACRKFHVDGYPLRLICTYDGPGTEWLPNNQVNRRSLGTKNEQIVKDHTRIRQMDRFHVGIMKGDDLASHARSGIVHRSPTIQDLGLRRLVLRIDT